MLAELQTPWVQLTRESDIVRERARALSPSAMVRVAAPGEWSALQIVAHLMLSSETIGTAQNGERAGKPLGGLFHRLIVIALNCNARLPIPDEAINPETALPDGVSLDELLERWQVARGELQNWLESVSAGELKQCPFVHAVIGPMTARQLLELGVVHTAYHRRQLEPINGGVAIVMSYPSDELRARLSEVEPYPDGVAEVPEELSFTAFFPGGAGVMLDEQGVKPPFPSGKVMIVGHNFYHLAGFELMRAKRKRDAGTPTWRNLKSTLERAEIMSEDCFFTNAYQGLMETESSMGVFPGAKDEAFVVRCQGFFRVQLAVCQPRLVITLGVHVPPFLAFLSDELRAKWVSDKGKTLTFTQIDENDGGLIAAKVAGAGQQPRRVCFVALTHPAQQLVNVKRRRFGELESYEAEEALLRAGVKSAFPVEDSSDEQSKFGDKP